MAVKGRSRVELEERVKALEYEVKILKNEIQHTLLDIQEQVLVHYYPSLRAESSTPSDGMAQAVEALRSTRASAEPAPLPTAKKVSLEEVKVTQSESAAPRSPASEPPPGAGSNQNMTVKLSGWVTECSAKLGGARTGQLVKVCAAHNLIASESQGILQKLAAFNKGEAPKEVAVNEVLELLLKLYELSGRAVDMDQVLQVIEEADLG